MEDFTCFLGSIGVYIRLMADGSPEKFTPKEWSQRGNAARSRKLSPERRKEIARLAAQARWKKKNGGGGGGGGNNGGGAPANKPDSLLVIGHYTLFDISRLLQTEESSPRGTG